MKFSIDKKLIFVLLLWLMLWAGYNTDIFRLKFLNFPINFLDLFHGLRSLLPFLAGFLAIILLLKQPSVSKIFRGPLGFLLVYALVGIISSIFLSTKPSIALYWAISYIMVLAVLFLTLVNANSISLLNSLINLNWIIVFAITICLFIFFLFQPDVISSLAKGDFWGERPYESLAGISAEKETFGMVGTRPTGLGRYAGVIAIFALARTILNKERKKILWYLLFLFFFFLLYFSQARTAIFGFIFGIFLIFLLKSKSKTEIFGWSFFTIFLLVLTSIFLFYPSYLGKKVVTPQISLLKPRPEVPPSETPSPETSTSETSSLEAPISQTPPILLTLSGRTTSIWPRAVKLFLKSPLIGWGFHADRIFLEGQHAHNAILHALIQTGIIGTIPFVLAFILGWIILFKFLKNPSLTEKPFLIEIAGVMAFFMVRSITESTGAFFGADWLLLAPLVAYLQQLNQKS